MQLARTAARSVPPTAGALVSVRRDAVRARARGPGQWLRVGSEAALRAVVFSLFLAFESIMRARVRALSSGAAFELRLKAIPAVIVSLGCYVDPSWVNYACVGPETLERALRIAEE